MGLSGLLRRGVEPWLLLNWDRLEGRSGLPTTNVDNDFCNDWKPKLKSDRTDVKPLSRVGPSVLSPLPITLHSHYDDVIMSEIASQITSLTIVYSTVHLGADQSKHQSSASLAFVWEIHRWPVNFPHKWPVTRKIFPFDDVIMSSQIFNSLFNRPILIGRWFISVPPNWRWRPPGRWTPIPSPISRISTWWRWSQKVIIPPARAYKGLIFSVTGFVFYKICSIEYCVLLKEQ